MGIVGQLPVAVWPSVYRRLGGSAVLLWPTSITATKDGKHIVIGFYSGAICLTDFTTETKVLQPRQLLFGHKTPIAAMAEAFFSVDGLSDMPANAVISASEDGTLISWDPRDGRCLAQEQSLPGRASEMKTLRSGRHIVVCGYFPNVMIISASTLAVVRVMPTYQSGYLVTGVLFFYTEGQVALGEGVLTMAMDATIESFSLRAKGVSQDSVPTAPIKKSKLQCDDAVTMSINLFTNSTVLVVRKTTAQVYMLSGLEFLIDIPCPNPSGWEGGTFIAHTEVLLWSTTGVAHQYLLPDSLGLRRSGRAHLFKPPQKPDTSDDIASRKAREAARITSPVKAKHVRSYKCDTAGGDPNSSEIEGDNTACQDSILDVRSHSSYRFTADVLNQTLMCIDHESNIHIWSTAPTTDSDSPTATAASKDQLSMSTKAVHNIQRPLCSHNVARGLSLDNSGELESVASNSFAGFNNISCGARLGDNELALGYSDGTVRVITIEELLMRLLGSESPAKPSPLLQGHSRSVSALLHPFTYGSAADPSVFVSGSVDCSVVIWKDQTKLHTFNNQVGVILNLFCPPASSILLRRSCFCSIASDHSFAIYSIDALSCMHLINGLSSPVQEVRWRCADDYMVLWCKDRSAYVWQLSTGHLDRKVTGQLALDILSACDAFDHQKSIGATNQSSKMIAHGVMFKLLEISSELGMLPVFIFDIESMISSLSRKAGSTTSTGMVEREQFYRDIVRRACAILLSHETGLPENRTYDAALKEADVPCNPNRYTVGLVNDAVTAFSLPLPQLYNYFSDKWTRSSYLSTTNLLCVTALLHALHRTEGKSKKQKCWLQIMEHFTDHLQFKTLAVYCKPSLIQLTLLWEHWQHDVQRVARAQLQIQLNDMLPTDRERVVRWAFARVPKNIGGQYDDEKVAAITLLGIIAHTNRSALGSESDVVERIATQLTAIVEDKVLPARHRAAAAEVLGQAYDALKDFCNLSSIFMILIELASTASASGAGAAPLHALKNLASSNIHQFVDAINNELFHASGTFVGHNSMLKVLRLLVKTHPQLLAPEISKVVDTVVRCFDPSSPKVRDLCFKQALGVLHEMCIAYEVMELHDARLAVGTTKGLINIYDLKSATRWQAIPAHPASLSSVKFSQDGKLLASFSESEKHIKVWHVGTSFFGMLSTAPKCISDFDVGRQISGLADEEVRGLVLIWTKKKTLVLTNASTLEVEFQI